VRAKVAALRAAQVPEALRPAELKKADQYLQLADEYVRAAGGRPLLLLVTGLMGTGKSTLARRLSEELETEVLATDEVRTNLLPKSDRPDEFGEGRYRPEARARVYAELFQRAAEMLSQGISVVLDGTFTAAVHREEARRLGRQSQADVLIVECVCPRETAIERIRSRSGRADESASEARPELYDLQAAERQRGGRAFIDLTIDSADSISAQATRLCRALPSPFPQA
jgi:predicted kinase